jgi:lipopolysaccharide/colanic/teichoic acid biosynthesis glycosyltransferase
MARTKSLDELPLPAEGIAPPRPALLALTGEREWKGAALGARGRQYVLMSLEAALGMGVMAVLAALGSPLTLFECLAVMATMLISGSALGHHRKGELMLAKRSGARLAPAVQLTGVAMLVFVAGAALDGRSLGANHLLELATALIFAQICAQTFAEAIIPRFCAEERNLLVGPAGARRDFRRHLEISGISGVEITAESDDLPLAGLETHIKQLGIERMVIFLDGTVTGPDSLEVVHAARAAGVKTTIVSCRMAMLGTDVSIEQVGPGVVMHSTGRPDRPRAKRLFDVIGAGLAILLLAPVLAVIAVLVRIDSPGPVFFRQRRVGRDGQSFSIMKFRTMVADAEALKSGLLAHNEADGIFKMKDDPRITRIGRTLRRTALDELPQLINVLRGEMSLVGPRPLVPDEDAGIQGWQRRRLTVAPGITGPWQVMGSARIGVADMAALDNLYVSDWTLMYDVRMLLRTVGFMLSRRGL